MSQISYRPELFSMSDSAILKEICGSLKRIRVSKNISQKKLSELTGLNRVTISRFESGRAANLITIIQILRALDSLDILSPFFKEPEVSPLLMWKVQEKQRVRAYGVKRKTTKELPESEW